MGLSDIYKILLRLPEDRSFGPDEDLTMYYQQWGFTIYRTTYTVESNQHWQAIIDRIQAQLSETIMTLDGAHKDDPATQHVLSLFRLDIRSDPETLKDLSMDEVREVYKGGKGGEPMNKNDPRRRHFLLVDKDVLAEEYGKGTWLKCISADYVAAEHVPRNTRFGPQRYFGWMKMTTRSLVKLWECLVVWDLQTIAPPAIGGAHLVTWDGPESM